MPIGYLFLPEPPEEKSCPSPICVRWKAKRNATQPRSPGHNSYDAAPPSMAPRRSDRVRGGTSRFRGKCPAKRQSRRNWSGDAPTVGLADGWAANVHTWQESVGELRRAIEIRRRGRDQRHLGNNTHRKLEVGEFRGFRASDVYAPLIFVNGSDAKSAQMFTLLTSWLTSGSGRVALTNAGLADKSTNDIEAWCDTAAAEFLVPGDDLKALWKEVGRTDQPFRRSIASVQGQPNRCGTPSDGFGPCVSTGILPVP